MTHGKSTLKEGDSLPPINKAITQQDISEYGYLMEGGRKTNLIHYDKKIAQQFGFKDTLAHGTIGLGLISEAMANLLGRGWIEGGKMSVKFIRPVFCNETITAKGVISELKSDGETVRISVGVWCENQHAEKVIVGSASGYKVV